MPEHLVLLADADVGLAERTRAALAPYGARVVVLDDINETLTQNEVPSLVVLCIDPKRVGWSVCNKLKKHPVLRSVPLIVTSAEASAKDFEDHQKLKTRAEEYLLKPYSVDGLVERIRSLLGGLEVQVSGEFVLPPADLPEMSGEDILIEDDEEPASPFGVAPALEHDDAPPHAERRAPSLTPPMPLALVQAEEPVLTAALGSAAADDLSRATPPSPFAAFAPPSMAPPPPPLSVATAEDRIDDDDVSLDLEPTPELEPAPAGEPILEVEPVAEPDSDPDPIPASEPLAAIADAESEPAPAIDAAPEADAIPEIDADLDATPRDEAMLAEAPAPVAESTAEPVPEPIPAVGTYREWPPDGEVPSRSSEPAPSPGEIDSLRSERDRLARELGELRAARASDRSGPISTTPARELLQLREVIMQKDREILALRDSVAARDRAALEERDRMREADHSRRDAEERLLDVDRQLIEAQERIESAETERLASEDRERTLRARIDEERRRAEQALAAFAQEQRAALEAERSGLRAETEQKLAEKDLGHAELVSALRARHDEERAAADTQRADLERDLAAALADAAAQRERLESQEREAQRLDRELGEQREEHALLKEQAVLALHRLRGEAAAAARVRKALTVAQALLDEGFTPDDPAAE